MTVLILEDAASRPGLFDWNGPVEAEALADWLALNQVLVPSDLLKFWAETGGGDAFETETLLGPFGNVTKGEDVVGVNAHHKERGLNSIYLVFHIGLGLSAVRLTDLRYVSLDDSYQEVGTYESFDAWYRSTIRAEYAERYHLNLF